jgi:hypothetical protein
MFAAADTPSGGGTLRPGQKNLAGATPDRMAEVIEAAVDDTTLHDPLQKESPDDPALVAIWESNKPDMHAELRRITLYFGPPEVPGKPPPAALVPVELTLEKDAVVLPHTSNSRANRREENPGRINEGTKKLMGLTAGAGFWSFTIGVPKTESNNERGVLICPQAKVVGEPVLKLWGVKYEAASHVAGKMLSGLGTGTARVSIQTSPSLPPPREWTDHSIGMDPSIIFDYLPVTSFSPPRDKQIERSVGGIESTLDLKNSAGYRRVTVMRDVATIQGVTLDEKQADDFITTSNPGSAVSCYAMIVEHTRTDDYEAPKPAA